MARKKSKGQRPKSQARKKRDAPHIADVKRQIEAQRRQQARDRASARALAKLKRLGLYRGSGKITPSSKKAISEFRDVLKGKARVLTIKESDARLFKRQGIRTRGNKVVLPKSKNVDYTRRGGKIIRKEKIGRKEIEVEVNPLHPRENLERRLNEIKKNPKYKGKLVGFKVRNQYGTWNSHSTFSSIGQAIRRLNEYKSEDLEAFYDSVEFVVTTKDAHQRARRADDRRLQKQYEQRRRRDRKDWRLVMKEKSPKHYQLYLGRKRSEDKRRYATEKYRAANRARMRNVRRSKGKKK